ncbi:histidine kinase [Streptomyces sp. NPDC006251]|uniref:sensor histidine kinase n=1 Tax=Streptomyces sp. NPDC006251 TaxID=3155718 RepID=UPI0033BB1596
MTQPPAEDLAARPIRGRGILRATVVAMLVFAAYWEQTANPYYHVSLWWDLLVLPVCLVALAWPVAKRPAWFTAELRTAVPAGLALIISVLRMTDVVHGDDSSFAVSGALSGLQLIAVRDCRPRWVVGRSLLVGVALLAQSGPFGVFQGAGMAALGGYLRALAKRRRAAVAATQRAERLAMAADLHDFVAHHVTGILMQARMAQMVRTTDPEQLETLLEGVVHGAAETLASMRRTVGFLRDSLEETAEGKAAADRRIGTLASLPELVQGFGGPIGPQAVLHRDESVPDDLPYDIQVAAYRVVQEALTNIRRHAADATEVAVHLAHDGRALEVAVLDNGKGGTALPAAARGGGFGLVGLTERVTALGGELRTGPRPDRGWQVTAVLPAAAGDPALEADPGAGVGAAGVRIAYS